MVTTVLSSWKERLQAVHSFSNDYDWPSKFWLSQNLHTRDHNLDNCQVAHPMVAASHVCILQPYLPASHNGEASGESCKLLN